MLLLGFASFPEATSLCSALAASIAAPVPEALSLALGCGWQMWAMTTTISFDSPGMVATQFSISPG